MAAKTRACLYGTRNLIGKYLSPVKHTESLLTLVSFHIITVWDLFLTKTKNGVTCKLQKIEILHKSNNPYTAYEMTSIYWINLYSIVVYKLIKTP